MGCAWVCLHPGYELQVNPKKEYTHEDGGDDVGSILDAGVVPSGLSIGGCRDKLIVFIPVSNLLTRRRQSHDGCDGTLIRVQESGVLQAEASKR